MVLGTVLGMVLGRVLFILHQFQNLNNCGKCNFLTSVIVVDY